MHIPSVSKCDLKIMPFEEALISSLHGSCDYDVNEWLFVPPFYDEYRYILGTRGDDPLICIGINPSTAAPGNLDNTLKSVERIAEGNGFDSFLMFNVYAQRATRPDDMDKELNDELHRENMKAFEYLLSIASKSGKKPAVWAAWGAIIEKRDYLIPCLADMLKIGLCYNAEWFTCGAISKRGHPHHPLYLRKDLKLDPFDVEKYLSTVFGSICLN